MELYFKKPLMQSIKNIAKSTLYATGLFKEFKASESISKNYINSTPLILEKVEKSLIANCKEFGIENIEIRLNKFRRLHVPFLNQYHPLKGSKVLEIGCGTGSSTVALTEQGCNVTGIDVDRGSLEVAKERLHLYRQEADFRLMNCSDISKTFEKDSFDIVIFFATMEHLTNAEKKEAIAQSWAVTKPGGLWCILGTPNLLWHFDIHTSLLPHYFWLPDDIAFEYAQFSPRKEFAEDLKEKKFEDYKIPFARWGRGVSYHFLDLYVGDVTKLKVLNSLEGFLRSHKSWLQRLFYKRTLDYKFKSMMQRTGRVGVQLPFYENYLDVIIKK